MGAKSLIQAALVSFSVCLAGASTWGVTAPDVSKSEFSVSGTWTLSRIECDNGVQGVLSYDAVFLQLTPPTVTASLSHDGCDISLEGTAEQNGNELTIEFNSGSWSLCSGPLPSYIWNRFEVLGSRQELHLAGQDLSPFGSCSGGPGRLVFLNK